MTKSIPLQVGVHEAKTRLSELLRLVDAGQEVEIARGGKPVARLVPAAARPHREWGIDEGVFDVPDDFDSPDPEIIDPWYA
ncbi:type II toxin-antitoxin system Phd/YefM family antitoxin [Nocardioides sp.]|uniref:type II toxin-antitoxin system Phd/YefM family antitoxin n=1 Tax=Nocardioides sp. TaxID=35761 RepID=UPI0039E22A4A